MELFSEENVEIFLQDTLEHFNYFEFISPKEFIIKFLPETHIFINNDLNDHSISSENIWKNYKISPSTDILNYELPIVFLICDSYIIWSLKNSELALQGLIEEKSLYSTNKSQFFHLWSSSENEKEENENLFTCENLPLQIQKIINFSLKAIRFNECVSKNQKDIFSKIEKNERNSFVEHYKESNEFGTFIAFEDYMVKCCFSDRTMVTINDNENLVMILTKKGERITQKITEKNEFAQ